MVNVNLYQVADQVAREKGIDRDLVIAAMESAIQTASRKKYGAHKNIQVKFDTKSGEFTLQQLREVVDEENFVNEDLHLLLEDALRLNPMATLGDFLSEELPPIEYGRIAAQTAKQVIVQKMREAERERIYQEYVERKGQLVNGLVKRIERNNIHVDLGRALAFMPSEEQLPRERYRLGDRIRAYIADVRDATKGPQIILSRSHPSLVAKLFEMEVPEIYDRVVEIKAVARDAGFRSKIAVTTHDAHVDPVGACVGMRGSRVQAVVTELQGERIDIIEWSGDPAVFVCNALAPAEVNKVIMDEEERSIKVVVSEDQLSLSIGRRGQNVRLASELTGWKIDIVTESEELEKRSEQFGMYVTNFMERLDLDEDVATAMVQEGFSSIEEVAYVPLEELAGIEGFDEELAKELRTRARDLLIQNALVEQEGGSVPGTKGEEKVKSQPGASAVKGVADIPGVSRPMAEALAGQGVTSLEDFADLSIDELNDLLTTQGVPRKSAEEMILAARRLAGWID